MGTFPFYAELHGELDCWNRRFEGELRKGYYMVGADKYAFQGVARSLFDPTNVGVFFSGVWSVTEASAGNPYDSPSNPGSAYPPDTDFPAPLEVQPGSPFEGTYPVGFEGGTGQWNAALVSETPQPIPMSGN